MSQGSCEESHVTPRRWVSVALPSVPVPLATAGCVNAHLKTSQRFATALGLFFSCASQEEITAFFSSLGSVSSLCASLPVTPSFVTCPTVAAGAISKPSSRSAVQRCVRGCRTALLELRASVVRCSPLSNEGLLALRHVCLHLQKLK